MLRKIEIEDVRKLEFLIINTLQKVGVGTLSIKEIKEKVISSSEGVEPKVVEDHFETSIVKLTACGFLKDGFGNQLGQSDVLIYERDSTTLDIDKIIMLDFRFSDLDWSDFETSMQASFAINEPSSLHIIAHKHLYG